MKRVILMVIWAHFWVIMTEREYNEHPASAAGGGGLKNIRIGRLEIKPLMRLCHCLGLYHV